jgi:hypothetical protein
MGATGDARIYIRGRAPSSAFSQNAEPKQKVELQSADH